MPNAADDWWDTPTPRVWMYSSPPKGTRYIIERARRIPCFGDPGYIVEWFQWGIDYHAKEERDAALIKESDENPMWRLRARDIHPHDRPYAVMPGINPPVET